MDGIELIRKLKQHNRNFAVIVLTGHEIEQYKEAALSAGADTIVSKMDDNELLRSIRDLIDNNKAS
jgi:DNA-binding NarL/FixJ family response regulator